MIFVDYPLIGEFRFITMIFEWIFAIICLEFGLLFLFRHKKEQYRLKYSQDFGYIILFFGLSLKSILSVLGSYFSRNIPTIQLLHFFSLIPLFFGFLLFISVKEKQRKYMVRKYFLTICLSIISIIFLFLFILANQLVVFDLIIFLSFVFIFFLLFYLDFIKKSQINISLTIKILTTLVPFSFLLIGLFFTSNYTLDLSLFPFRLIGSLFQLVGIVFFTIFFLRFPILTEFDWKDKIEEVLLINKDGACLFYRSFIQKADIYDENLISGAISLINIMLKEIMKSESEDVSVIKKKDKVTYIFPSDLLTGVIFSNEESKMAEFYLKQLVVKIETVYKNILLNWDGDLGIFDPIDNIFQEIFSE